MATDDTPDNVDLNWVARTLLAIQREIRSLRDDVTVVSAILNRIDNNQRHGVRVSRSSIRQLDVQKAIRAARASGLDVGRVEIDAAGKISISLKGDEGGERKPDTEANPWHSVELPKRKKWSRK